MPDTLTCSACGQPFAVPTNCIRPFCTPCLAQKLGNAVEYQQRIAAGDLNVEPANAADAATVLRVISDRLRATGSTPDCQYSWRRPT